MSVDFLDKKLSTTLSLLTRVCKKKKRNYRGFHLSSALSSSTRTKFTLSVSSPCRWNQLDLLIILLSIVGIVLEEMNSELPINPTIIRVMRVLRIARGGYREIWYCIHSVPFIFAFACLEETRKQCGRRNVMFNSAKFDDYHSGKKVTEKKDVKIAVIRISFGT